MAYSETAQSERLYSRVAPAYETVFERAILAEGRLTAMVRRYMDGERVLDLACGNGRWLTRFAPGDYTVMDWTTETDLGSISIFEGTTVDIKQDSSDTNFVCP